MWRFGDLPIFGHSVVVVDPAWDFVNYSDKGTAKGADPHYQTMPLDEIKGLRIGELARGDCLVLLWATGCMLPQALDVLAAWGCVYKSQLVWRKVTRSGKRRMGTGYRVRSLHEPVLLGTFGRPKHKPLPSLFDGVAREHSRKPAEFYDLVAAATPGANRCDLFAREHHPGFAAWGDEVGKFKAASF
jgi:N6-adenosine-specific RNA methylase IME4